MKKFFVLLACTVLFGTGCVQATAVPTTSEKQGAAPSSIAAEADSVTPQFIVEDNKLLAVRNNEKIVLVAALKEMIESKIPEIMKERQADLVKAAPEQTDGVSFTPSVRKLSSVNIGDASYLFFSLRVKQGGGDCDRFCYAVLPVYAKVKLRGSPLVSWVIMPYEMAPVPALLFEPGAVFSVSPSGRYLAFILPSKSGKKNFYTYDLLTTDPAESRFEFNLDDAKYLSLLQDKTYLDWSTTEHLMIRSSTAVPAGLGLD